ncbi:class III signal peptide-containing protein [Thermococcus sp. 18S1]|uniref:class III signal peptide-containing protein n=1 Tax=Thermococcus sp. 18S1 TaxID=1638210 RepID=UPI00143907F9|nr:class III signal peptide-containing protein [Thermococcus sp. 18S1]NJE30390.1 class III signal peptide-containing protein [Thermococcus sp. 18S1]
MKIARRGQVSLEFMLVFGIMLILLLYSVNSITFQQGSTSTETLKMQVLLEEKSLANAIAGTIAQVYAQGPGAKSTTYVKVTYLAEPDYLQKAFGSTKVTMGGTQDSVLIWVGDSSVTSGANKNTVSTEVPYSLANFDDLSFSDGLPSKSIRIVVTWDPGEDEGWSTKTSGNYLEITINIRPGG